MRKPLFLDLLREAKIRIPGRKPRDFEARSITCDSRRVEKNSIFVAIRGSATDGNHYIPEALNRGAAFVMTDSPKSNSKDIPLLSIKNARAVYGKLNHLFYGKPAESLSLIGVTGTNGKTTSASLLHHILNAQAKNATTGLLTTVETLTPARRLKSTHTTPDASFIHSVLRECVDGGFRNAVLEVSSHALEQERLAGLKFDGALFTNISHEHLDYHRDMDHYLDAKAKLFQMIKPRGASVLNRDDASFEFLSRVAKGRIISYGTDTRADFVAKNIQSSLAGSRFEIQGVFGRQKITTPLIGRHNIYNILGVFATLMTQQLTPERLSEAIKTFEGVPGRCESVQAGQDFKVFIDYAHTDDGLKNILEALKPLTKKRLLLLFGCGGDRDKEKRPQMAKAAELQADFIVLTSDNPRTENPLSILKDIERGFSADFKDYEVQPDRRKAIRTILLKARRDDLVLLAGKGHETVQVCGDEEIPFSDKEESLKALGGK